MDNANEVIEVSEQKTPFHLLPQEEQQRILDANQKRVREAPTLHEWDIRVPTAFVWLGIFFLIGIPVLIGSAMLWNESSDGWIFIIVGGIMFPYLRFLVMADKDYHYRLTTEGVIVTYQDAIPESAYTIVRGLAWFGVVVCMLAVSLLGPLALVGAGGMALFAIFFTGFQKEVTTLYLGFNKNCTYVCKVVKKKSLIRFETVPFEDGAFSDLHCEHKDFIFILKLLMSELDCKEYREFNTEISLRRSPLGVLEVGLKRNFDK
ncbi:hypothetical protein CF115_12705 [Aeromonas veronii]|uniref:hypothetical protein n=1 Tax=Aeromonas veronii TaxID=654 RepID=UPI0011160B41|nr:hypothetical protein [Aeromonas veronii]TNJ06889.1 hypothetical protein CF115_12705 [Aeromonas veronii]